MTCSDNSKGKGNFRLISLASLYLVIYFSVIKVGEAINLMHTAFPLINVPPAFI